MNYHALQKKHPLFHYQSFSFSLVETETNLTDLLCTFTYQLENGPTFTHRVHYHQIDPDIFRHQDSTLLNQLVFHLGLVEALSYWKLAASPTFIIHCGTLNQTQISWWQDLLVNGMGEYFYVNQIDDFLQHPPAFEIAKPNDFSQTPAFSAYKNHQHSLTALGIGGGKDSAVMLSFFQKNQLPFVNLILQPASPAATKMAHLNQKPTHFISRQFDPQLFALNSQNYLNGHVPFSAIFAFISLLAGVLYDFDFIAVGNENSANQPSLNWHDFHINHQFSKSTKFEQSFREYSSHYLIDNVEYYSLIRPFSEIKIAQLFCTNPQFFSIFKSCNRFQQKDAWCEKCPKCLFVFLILSPFLDTHTLTSQIFSHQLFDDLELLPIFKQLLGFAPTKPLECIGTIEESQLAVYLTIKKYKQQQQSLPPLLAAIAPALADLNVDWQKRAQDLLHTQTSSFLPPSIQTLISNN